MIKRKQIIPLLPTKTNSFTSHSALSRRTFAGFMRVLRPLSFLPSMQSSNGSRRREMLRCANWAPSRSRAFGLNSAMKIPPNKSLHSTWR
jgi:hypothetical protein